VSSERAGAVMLSRSLTIASSDVEELGGEISTVVALGISLGTIFGAGMEGLDVGF
jgi:hypothetical protein